MSTQSVRNRVIEAAGPIFAEKGYQRATVRDICLAAGVNLAAVNYYFGDKETLYLQTVKTARQSRVDEAPLPDWSADTEPGDKLRDFIQTMLKRMLGMQQAPWQVRLMLRELLQPSELCKPLVQEYFKPHFEILVGIVSEVLPPDSPRHVREQVALSIIGQCAYYRLAGEVISLVIKPDNLPAHDLSEKAGEPSSPPSPDLSAAQRSNLHPQYDTPHLAEHITRFSLAALGLGPTLGSSS